MLPASLCFKHSLEIQCLINYKYLVKNIYIIDYRDIVYINRKNNLL